jgi:FkbM family methyltransferase
MFIRRFMIYFRKVFCAILKRGYRIFFAAIYPLINGLSKLPLVKDKLISELVTIKSSGEEELRILDFGSLSRYRASSLLSKEPETIDWINGFSPKDVFFDVGANIGVYSLYAAAMGIENIVAFEPHSLNYALLNSNIFQNHFQDSILAFPIALHEKLNFSTLNIGNFEWGGAHSSFERVKDQYFQDYKPTFKQGCFGFSLDDFVELTSLSPSHIKIDVDGNEICVLQGALKTLSKSCLKSLLIELFPTHPEYRKAMFIIESAGFKQKWPLLADHHDSVNSSIPVNHIFHKS